MYTYLWEKNNLGLEVIIPTLSGGAAHATMVDICYPYTALIMTCNAICYQTLRSAFMQAIKWHLHLHAHELIATKIDVKQTSYYFFT
jgi:hypothetical protein